MTTFTEHKFDIPELQGLSKKSIDEHLALYAGYVKNFNALTALAGEMMQDKEKNALAIAELMRRRSFEFGGMRLHEYYFKHLEGGTNALNEESDLGKAIIAQYGKADYCMQELKAVAGLRGPGWSILYWDPMSKQFLVGFTEEQHLGSFPTLPIIVALDVWEHTYITDFGASGRGKYIEAFFANLNWQSAEANFAAVR